MAGGLGLWEKHPVGCLESRLFSTRSLGGSCYPDPFSGHWLFSPCCLSCPHLPPTHQVTTSTQTLPSVPGCWLPWYPQQVWGPRKIYKLSHSKSALFWSPIFSYSLKLCIQLPAKAIYPPGHPPGTGPVGRTPGQSTSEGYRSLGDLVEPM